MKFPNQSSGGTFQKCPPGNHMAICYEVIDLGTQESTYQGKTKHQRKIWIGWETPHELMDDGRPFVIGRRYTLSSHEKATLRRDLESWRGKKFADEDFGPTGYFAIESIIGKACFLNVVHSDEGDRTYANISSVAALPALPKGTEVPPQTNPSLYLSLEAGEFSSEAFASLSERMQDTIAKSPEYQDVIGDYGGTETRPIDEDGSPF